MKGYKSTPGAVRDFIGGSVWSDMQIELNGAVEQMRDGLEIAKDFESVLRLQECIDTIRRVIEMPRVILEDMEDSRVEGVAEDILNEGD